MLSKEMYEELNKKVNINKKQIPTYEEFINIYKQVKDITDNPDLLEDSDEEILTIIELFCMHFGLMSLAIFPQSDDKGKEKNIIFIYFF